MKTRINVSIDANIKARADNYNINYSYIINNIITMLVKIRDGNTENQQNDINQLEQDIKDTTKNILKLEQEQEGIKVILQEERTKLTKLIAYKLHNLDLQYKDQKINEKLTEAFINSGGLANIGLKDKIL